jgi:hypothetical protein
MTMTASQFGLSPKRLGIVLAAALLVGGLGASVATAAFDDVSPESAFAEHVENISEAGIATGYPDGTFRPRQPINRQQAAAWIARSAGRIDYDFHVAGPESSPLGELNAAVAESVGVGNEGMESTGPPLTPASPTRTMATLDVNSGAAGGDAGFVVIDGAVYGATENATGAGCPCAVDVLVLDGDDQMVGWARLTVPGAAEDDERTEHGPMASAPIASVIPLDGTQDEIRIVATLVDADVAGVLVAGVLNASYVPFAADGGSEL